MKEEEQEEVKEERVVEEERVWTRADSVQRCVTGSRHRVPKKHTGTGQIYTHLRIENNLSRSEPEPEALNDYFRYGVSK